MSNRTNLQTRELPMQFQTRAEGDDLFIEGYFSIFDSIYEVWYGGFETVAKGAFSETLDGDIRALINHDTMYVLGRTTAGTLELKEDETGLWGRIHINPNDGDAMNLYERVKRGDVSQCSFGFEILEENTEILENGDIHWTILKVRLHEVSVCTFPAYKDTHVEARGEAATKIHEKENEKWRAEMLARVKGDNSDGNQDTDDQEESR